MCVSYYIATSIIASKEELKYFAHELLSYSIRLLSTLHRYLPPKIESFDSLHASEETNRLPNATIKRHESTIPTGVMRTTNMVLNVIT